jgi:hypothetical protein
MFMQALPLTGCRKEARKRPARFTPVIEAADDEPSCVACACSRPPGLPDCTFAPHLVTFAGSETLRCTTGIPQQVVGCHDGPGLSGTFFEVIKFAASQKNRDADSSCAAGNWIIVFILRPMALLRGHQNFRHAE